MTTETAKVEQILRAAHTSRESWKWRCASQGLWQKSWGLNTWSGLLALPLTWVSYANSPSLSFLSNNSHLTRFEDQIKNCIYHSPWASLVAQRLKRLPPVQQTRVWSLGGEDPLEKEMVTHSSILAWRIPWTEEPSRLQSMGSQRVGHDWATSLHFWNILKTPYRIAIKIIIIHSKKRFGEKLSEQKLMVVREYF